MKDIPGANRTDTKSGTYSQPRYASINNKPGFTLAGISMEGLIPALANDFMALTPDKIFAALQGESVQNLFSVQPCPKVSLEGFSNFNTIESSKKFSYLIFFLIIIIVISLAYPYLIK